MTKVFILEHSYEIDDKDETKFIGVYTTNELAEQAILRLKNKPGFRDKPNDFIISECELNKDSWLEGYATMTVINVKDNNNNWIAVQAECLPNKTYQIVELHENETLSEFKHLDVVECEERNTELFAIRRV